MADQTQDPNGAKKTTKAPATAKTEAEKLNTEMGTPATNPVTPPVPGGIPSQPINPADPVVPPVVTPVTEPLPQGPATDPGDEEEDEEDGPSIVEIMAPIEKYIVQALISAHKDGVLTEAIMDEMPDRFREQLDAHLEEEEKKRASRPKEQYEADQAEHEKLVKQYGQGYVIAANGNQQGIFTARAWELLKNEKGERGGWKAKANTPPEVLELQKQQADAARNKH